MSLGRFRGNPHGDFRRLNKHTLNIVIRSGDDGILPMDYSPSLNLKIEPFWAAQNMLWQVSSCEFVCTCVQVYAHYKYRNA